MRPSNRFSPEQRNRWMDFLTTIHPESDPQTARLMDEFYVAYRQISQLMETSFERDDVSFPQFRVLMHLFFCEWIGSCDGLNPSEISEHQGTRRNTISALIRGLEDEGLVERQIDPEDRRRFNIRLTPAGRQKVLDRTSGHLQMINTLFETLSPEEIKTFTSVLHKLNAHSQTLKESRNNSVTGDEYATSQQETQA